MWILSWASQLLDGAFLAFGDPGEDSGFEPAKFAGHELDAAGKQADFGPAPNRERRDADSRGDLAGVELLATGVGSTRHLWRWGSCVGALGRDRWSCCWTLA